MTEELDPAAVASIVAQVGRRPECAVPILQRVQAHFGYLPEAARRQVSELTGITPAELTGIATFYSQFRLQPAGRHTIRVCIGTACHVKGATAVYDAFKRHLGIPDPADTDADRLFTVEQVACLGCCMLAPAVRIDDVTYGFVQPRKVDAVLRDFLDAQRGGIATRARFVPTRVHGEVSLCQCSSCLAGGSELVHREFERQIHALRLPVALREVGCSGISYQTPLVLIRAGGDAEFRYGMVKPADVRRMLLRHFRPPSPGRRTAAAIGRLLEHLVSDETWEPVTRYAVDLRTGPDARYVGPQKHISTEHWGEDDPLDLAAYRARGGFTALGQCLDAGDPDALVDVVTRSGLRGRGGAGYPTGKKWGQVRAAADTTRYLVCNADEGDPGAFMDRMLLESFPFRVLEGMAIAAMAVGASEGALYIRAEYPLAAERIRHAIAIAEDEGVLGRRLLGKGPALHLRVVEGAGAFVCGEETALLAAIEGRRGMPVYRPPYPAERGLWGKPTLINNVETYALVPWIIRHGAEAFAALGTPSSRGTKAFALSGKIVRGGLIEVPMGITLRQIVEDIGGGVGPGRTLKAIQVGGPSGGCVPAALADTPVDYEHLNAVGAMMGSGGMVVLDDTDCMVDMARYFMVFSQDESCGKCTHCRIGTTRMLDILTRLCDGKGQAGDLEQLERLASVTQSGSLCGLGRTAPNPVLSTLRHFRGEYEAHLAGRCPAHKCRALLHYRITDACIGCTRCAQRCPVQAIPITPYELHVIDQAACTQCDTCRQVCPADAVNVE